MVPTDTPTKKVLSNVKLYYLLCHYPGKTVISSYEGTVKLLDVVEVEVFMLSSYPEPRHLVTMVS